MNEELYCTVTVCRRSHPPFDAQVLHAWVTAKSESEARGIAFELTTKRFTTTDGYQVAGEIGVYGLPDGYGKLEQRSALAAARPPTVE